MSNRDTLIVLAEQLALALQPLDAVLGSPDALRDFLEDLGWNFDVVPAALDSLRLPVQEAFGLVSKPDGMDAADGARVISSVRAASQAILRLGSDAGLAADFRDEFPRQVLDYLVVEHLLNNQPRFGYLLVMLGIVSLEEMPAAGTRIAYLRRDLAWESLSPLLRDPRAFLANIYRWGESDFTSDRLIAGADGALGAWGAQVREGLLDAQTAQNLNTGALQTDQTTDAALYLILLEHSMNPQALNAGVGLFPLPETAATKPGFALLPFATTGLDEEVAISDRLALSVRGDLDLAGGAGMLIRPNRDAELVLGLASGGPAPASGHLAVQLRLTNAGPPVTLVGSPDASRFELQGVSTTTGMKLLPSGALDAFVEFALEESRIVVKPDADDVDGFLASLLPADGLHIDTSLTIGFSKARGLYFSGGGGLEISVPTHIHAGPIEIESALIAVRPADRAFAIDLAATLGTDLGVVKAAVQNVGLKAMLAFPPSRDGNLGPLQFDLAFRAPDGVSLSIDAHGVVTGGGALRYDAAQQMYSGAMQLVLHDTIALSAFGLIATKMPDGSRGFSMLIFIIVDGFKPIPLGLGFMLQSIGGMIGVNRTFDVDVLRAGLKSDSLATLLLPRDPVASAATLIQGLASAFPAKRGSYLLGLLARITWFTPTLVQLDLALILELGERTRLLMLGRVSSLLPTRDNDLIRLNLDVLGVLDFDAGTLEADAVLVDSRLVHQFPITGAAALRAGWSEGSKAGFVLAVGGLNPHFAPPAGFPQLERVTIALCAGTNPQLICDAYFAVTANTIQFGSHVHLYAEALGFSVTGDLGFDVLVTPVPLHFIADLHASVQLKRGSHNLFKVALDGTLEGPVPLHLVAKATFELLWWSVSVRFEHTFDTGGLAAVAVAAVDVTTELKKALARAESWSTQVPLGIAHGVALRGLTPGTGTVVDPLGQLVVKQQTVPLNTGRQIDTFAGAPVTGARTFNVSGSLNSQAGTPVQDSFAPARYFALSDDEKIVGPSFESMDAGLVLGNGAVTFDATFVAAPLKYEAITLDKVPAPTPTIAPLTVGLASALPAPYELPVEALKAQRPSGAAARGPVRRTGRARFRNTAVAPAARLSSPQWRIVRLSDGATAVVDPAVKTWSDYRAALAAMNRGGARWQMVPAHEMI